MWRQPKPVWAVAFACVIAFMGIGLVDPILKPIARRARRLALPGLAAVHQLHGGDGVAMLVTGGSPAASAPSARCSSAWPSSSSAPAWPGTSDTVGGIVGFRAVWGLGNALFIATALATIVSAARGSVGQAIILYEAALGLGIAAGPLLGGWLGSISWRGPFFGVSALMPIALAATVATAAGHPAGRRRHLARRAVPRAAPPRPARRRRSRRCCTTSASSPCWPSRPFPLDLGPRTRSASIFFGWGVLLAFTSVVVAPRLQRRFGTLPGSSAALPGFAAILAAMAIGTDHKAVLVIWVVVLAARSSASTTPSSPRRS